jgi:hypothetical protein
VQLKLFDRRLAEIGQLEADINQWLSASPKSIAIQRDIHVYHDHAKREEGALVALWYETKSGH